MESANNLTENYQIGMLKYFIVKSILFDIVYFVDRTIHEFKIPMNFLFTLVMFNIIWNPWN